MILGQSPNASYADPLVSTSGTYAGPPLVLAPEVLGMAPPPTVAPSMPEALVSPMTPASMPAPMATLGAPPPAMAAPSAALPPPPAPMAPRRAPAAPPAPRGAALAPGFGDFAGALAGVTADAKRLAAQPRLSEIGTIRENLATTQERLAKEALGEAQASAAEREAALTATQEAERASAAERTLLAGSAAEAARVAEENAAIERQRRAQAVEDTEKRFAAARDELDNTKIDVGAAYGSAGQRILSAVAIAMGAFGASISGGPNYALQIVNDRINRELDAQRSELEKKKGKVSELGRIFERNQNLLGDATQAANLTRAQTFRALADDVEARAKGRALAPQQAAALEQLRSQERANFAKLQEGIAMKSAEKAMVGAGERQAQRQAAAAAQGQIAKDRRELEMFTTKEAVKAYYAGKSPEAQSKLTEQTTALANKMLDKDYPAATGNYYDIASQVGIDPVTGKPSGKDPAGLGLVNLGVLTTEGRVNRQAINALAERMAKSFGGVVTESDREAAQKLLKGAGTVEDIQRGIYMYGQAIGRNMRTLQAGYPDAFDTMAGRLPLLTEGAAIGAQGDVTRSAQTATGFRPVGQ